MRIRTRHEGKSKWEKAETGDSAGVPVGNELE